MIAPARPPKEAVALLADLPGAAAPTLVVLARWLRPIGLAVVDVALCLASMLLPTLSCATALAVISLIGREMAIREGPAFGGFVSGALAVCVVACLLIWADRRHRWWSP